MSKGVIRGGLAVLTGGISEQAHLYGKGAVAGTKAVVKAFSPDDPTPTEAPPPPPPPTPEDPSVQKAADEQRRLSQGGRASTIMSGGRGVRSALSSARKTLLGS